MSPINCFGCVFSTSRPSMALVENTRTRTNPAANARSAVSRTTAARASSTIRTASESSPKGRWHNQNSEALLSGISVRPSHRPGVHRGRAGAKQGLRRFRERRHRSRHIINQQHAPTPHQRRVRRKRADHDPSPIRSRPGLRLSRTPPSTSAQRRGLKPQSGPFGDDTRESLGLIASATPLAKQWNRNRRNNLDIRRRCNLPRHLDQLTGQRCHASMLQRQYRCPNRSVVDKPRAQLTHRQRPRQAIRADRRLRGQPAVTTTRPVRTLNQEAARLADQLACRATRHTMSRQRHLNGRPNCFQRRSNRPID